MVMNTTTQAVADMVATKCACCGRKIWDSLSQETGMGPDCRKDHGYDVVDGATSWAHAFAALGATCPDAVYAIAFSARHHGQDDTTGIVGARRLANVLVKRLALARCGLVEDKLTVRINYVKAISALGFRKLAVRIAETGLGLDVATIETADSGAVRVVISRRGVARKSFPYASHALALAGCLGSLYPLVVDGGRVVGPEPSKGDWLVDEKTGEAVRAAYEGEERAGMRKVDGWTFFAQKEVETRFLARVDAMKEAS